ncbi:BTAD domain-containing putative transcriptional regulator [Actinoplanes sp. GCM10030250]|uniref:AfsR/SARP family transcriptional regulator n=1 Tax=Actinoplanes sp. GCM10030250 TaxID=3273376 RepID=UPI00360CF802
MRISILGPLSVTRDVTPVRVGAGRHRAVLARLALTPGRPVGREELISLLWGDAAPPAAANVVQTHVSRLRRLLAPKPGAEATGTVTLEPGGYVLHADGERLDLLAYRARLARAAVSTVPPQRSFDLLADALDMWLGDCAADDVPELANDPLVTALGEERVEVAIRLARLGEILRHERQVLPLLRRLARSNPWNEALHARLVVALAASGQQAAAIDAFDGIRRRLSEELGVDPSAELAEARQAVLARRWEPRERITAGATSYRAPSPPPDFCGRSAELRVLERALRYPADRPQPAAVCVVSGMAGVGKTSLALRASWALRRDFPDGQIYIDLRGADEQPIGVARALARLLLALGVEERSIPGDCDEAAALYRRVLDDRRVLVVLDNAHHAAQVRPLLPGPGGSAVLITSRNRCSELDGALHVDLAVLSTAEALELLSAVAGAERIRAEPDHAKALVGVCGRLPVALRVIGRRLAVRPGWTLAGLLDRLADEQSRLEQFSSGELVVMAGFELSCRELAPLPAAVFRAGALIPGEIVSAAAVAAVLKADEDVVRHALDTLVEGNLLQICGDAQYSYHDLLRLYALRSGEARHGTGGRSVALGRLYGWYLARTAAAMRLVYPDMVRLPVDVDVDAAGFPDVDAAMTWLNEEIGGLLAAVGAAAAGEHRRRSWQLADQLRGYFFVRGDVLDWLATGRTGLAAAEAAGDLRAQAAMHQTIGQAHWAAGKHRLAAEAYQRGLRSARDDGWVIGEAYLSHNLGLVRAESGDMDEADLLYRRALDLGDGPGFGHIRAVTLNDLGVMCSEQGRLTEAAGYLTEAARMNEAAARRASVMTNRSNLGMVLRQLERFDEARLHLDAALAHHRRTGSTAGEVCVLDELSQLYRQLSEWVAAVGAGAEAVRLARQQRYLRAEAGTLNTLAFALLGNRAFDEARSTFEEALRLSREHGYPFFEAQACVGIAEVALALGDPELAYRTAGDALAIAAHRALRPLHGGALLVQAGAALEMGDLATAFARCEAAMTVVQSAGVPGAVRECTALRDRIRDAGRPVPVRSR